MRAPETQKLFEILQGNIPPEEPQALFVGGCVRNVLLGKDIEDFDLATPLLPEDVIQILEKEGIRVIPTGLQHGTVTAIIGEYKYEITTLRRDVETDGRHAVVDYTPDWSVDAQRRDFTINTLLMDVQGNIYDPLQCGVDDLDRRCVRFVGDAKKRIEEDHLRILRFFRFSALYSDGFDEAGLKACEENTHMIKSLSKERITQEVFKIMASDTPQDVIKTMFSYDVLKEFEFAEYDAGDFSALCRFQKQYRLQALPSRLFAFSGFDFSNIKTMGKYILFPKVFIKDMQAIDGALRLPDLSCDLAVRRSIYKFGRNITAQVLMVELVQDRVMNRYAPRALELVQGWDIPTCPVNGGDIIKAGVEKGPKVGAVLEKIEDDWIEQDFMPNRQELLNRISTV